MSPRADERSVGTTIGVSGNEYRLGLTPLIFGEIQVRVLYGGLKLYCMSYGEYRRHQLFVVRYQINYPSGKKFITQTKTYSYSEIGAKDTVKWLKSSSNITILSVTATGNFGKFSSYPDNHCVGDR